MFVWFQFATVDFVLKNFNWPIIFVWLRWKTAWPCNERKSIFTLRFNLYGQNSDNTIQTWHSAKMNQISRNEYFFQIFFDLKICRLSVYCWYHLIHTLYKNWYFIIHCECKSFRFDTWHTLTFAMDEEVIHDKQRQRLTLCCSMCVYSLNQIASI